MNTYSFCNTYITYQELGAVLKSRTLSSPDNNRPPSSLPGLFGFRFGMGGYPFQSLLDGRGYWGWGWEMGSHGLESSFVIGRVGQGDLVAFEVGVGERALGDYCLLPVRGGFLGSAFFLSRDSVGCFEAKTTTLSNSCIGKCIHFSSLHFGLRSTTCLACFHSKCYIILDHRITNCFFFSQF